MSLTSALASPTNPVGRYIRQVCADHGVVPASWRLTGRLPLVVPTKTVDRGLVGTAIDYRLRLYLAGSLDLEETVAASGIRHAVGVGAASAAFRERQLADWQAQLGRVAVTRQVKPSTEQALARVCLHLARWEQVYRRQLTSAEIAAAWPDPAHLTQPDVDDMVALAALFPTGLAAVDGGGIIANPIFVGSVAIGGADADFIANVAGHRMLIEIKTVQTVRAWPEVMRQLVGYLLLDLDDLYGIGGLGVYLPRYGLLLHGTLAELLGPRVADLLPGWRNTLDDLLTRYPQE